MSLRIQRRKSIQKERLIFKSNWEYILEKAFEIFIYLGWTLTSIAIILNPKIAIKILVIISWYYIYKLLKIKIPNPEKNRSLFVKILKKRFPDLLINDNGLYMLRSKKRNGLFSWGKLLTVIFDENYIFINLTTLGRNETKSPLHSISNYIKLKSIEKEFNYNINGN